MPSSLNVVALISGGKDSLYSILHCIQNGHNVVALANLYPSTAKEVEDPLHTLSEGLSESDDINSLMYQTVGHGVLPLYASALKLPLYRRTISGRATQTGRYYAYTPTGPLDETEDLVPLLQEVLQHHAEVNAICSGAILSTYQRTRIESVAIRLGLTPLAFLWQYPALPPPIEREDSITGLLDDMAAAGCDCRIIKTASGGLSDSMLWANVTSSKTRSQLVAAMSPFFLDHEFWLRGSVLGEGGEYETLAINGPPRVWKQRIVVEEDGNTAVQDEGGASHLRLGNARLVEQEGPKYEKGGKLVRIPELYDPAFAALENEISASPSSSTTSAQSAENQLEAPGFFPPHSVMFQLPNSPYLKMSMHSTPKSIVISNITTTECGGASHQMSHLMKLLQTCIHSLNRERSSSAQLSVEDIVFSSLLLNSMVEFAAVNAEYSKIFAAPNPPARVTIACGDKLPDNVLVSLSVVLDTGPREKRRGLHVQSRSYWAPANIGPYSQAISVPFDGEEPTGNGEDGEIVHVAGQIPLVPHTMDIMDGTLLQQTVLSLQHLWRVGQERDVDLWTHGVAYLARSVKSADMDPETFQTVRAVWRGAHALSQKSQGVGGEEEDEDGPDAWDLRYNPYHHRGLDSANTAPARRQSGTHLHPLPRLSVIHNNELTAATTGDTFIPPLLIAEVESLPRSAPIEFHSLGLGGLPTTKPCIHVSTTQSGQGLANHFTVLANTPKQDAGELEPSANILDSRKIMATEMDFVTIQIYSLEELLGQRHTAPPTKSVSSIVSTISDFVNIDEWTVAQGTAYVASPFGWSVLSALQQPAAGLEHVGRADGWQGLSITPCLAVRGNATESGDCVRQLSLALVLRLERVYRDSASV